MLLREGGEEPLWRKGMSRKEGKKMKRRKITVLLAGMTVLVIAGILWLQKENSRISIEENQEEGSIEGLSEREIEELMARKVEEGSLAISINNEPRFPDGKSKGTLRIENPANNRYLMVVKIYLEGNGEKIYESGGIRPGNKLEYDYLDTKLSKGRYEVRAEFEAYEIESQEYVGKAASRLEIVIER